MLPQCKLVKLALLLCKLSRLATVNQVSIFGINHPNISLTRFITNYELSAATSILITDVQHMSFPKATTRNHNIFTEPCHPSYQPFLKTILFDPATNMLIFCTVAASNTFRAFGANFEALKVLYYICEHVL